MTVAPIVGGRRRIKAGRAGRSTVGPPTWWLNLESPSQARGSIHGMRTTIDKAGRLVIPRSLRDRIGLVGGGEVELELDGAAIRIEPVVGNDLREDGGLLFIPAAGTPITAAAVRELMDADRHGR